MTGETSALRRCVGDVARFAEAHWGRSPFIHHADRGFDDLLDIDAIERLLTDLGRRPTFRVVRADGAVRPEEYTMRTRVGGAEVDEVADIDRILALVAKGATIVMQGLHRTWPPLATFCTQLEADVGHPVQANAYLSPPAAAGLSEHSDDHDVIVVQVVGRKDWIVAGLGDVELDVGDVLYLPAGTRHAARTQLEPSLHITLGLLTTTYRHVIGRLLSVAHGSALDRPLPIGFSNDDRPTHDRFAAELHEALQAVIAMATTAQDDSDAVIAREVTRRRRRARRRHVGRLAAVIDPSTITPTTTLIRSTAATASEDGDSAVLQLSDRTIRMPAFTADALRWIASRTTIQPADLPGLDRDDQLTLVRRCVREGVLEIERD